MSTLKVNTIADPDNGNTAITIDSSGNAAFSGNVSVSGTLPAAQLTGTLPALDGSALTGISANTPYFHVWNSTQTSVPSNTTTKVTLDGTYEDDWNIFNASNSQFEPTTAGKYFIYFQVQSNISGSTSRWYAEIRKNGSAVATSIVYHYEYTCATVSCILDMNGSTDYVDFSTYMVNQSCSTSNDGRRTFALGWLLSEN